jgi:NADH:ubiquinone reductase (H+-translocating)
MTQTRIVVLGGGYGGVEAVKSLYRELKKRRDVEIVLVDKNPYHTFMTELHEVAGGRVEPGAVAISFRKIFGGKKITVVTDRITTIDFKAKMLVGNVGQYAYDYLVIGVGAEPEFYDIPGIRENAFTLWSLGEAVAIRRHIHDVFSQASKQTDPDKRAELLTFAIAGAGFTGMELAGELKDWRAQLCRDHGIDPSEVRIVVIEAVDKILPTMPERLQKKARRYLEKRGVEFRLGTPITGAEPGRVLLGDKGSIAARTFIWTAGIKACRFASSLRLSIARRHGRLHTNEFMQTTEYPEVYVVGDVVCFTEGEKMLPQIVETAVQTAGTAAHNIVAEIEGTSKKAFRSSYHGNMVSLGAGWGVAHVLGIPLSGFLAIVSKHLINVIHFLGVAGINQVWEYLKHEFLDIKNGRSVLGSLAAANTRGYWMAILRVFLGVMWLIEGIGKITKGWLTPGRIFIIATQGTASASAAGYGQGAAEATAAASGMAAQAADATAAATAAVAQAADATAAASAAASSGVGTALLSQPAGLYTWLVENLVSKAPFFFQVVIVLAEVLIGLALVGGLFTAVAAVVSIGLSIMFLLGAMAGKEILWYMAVSLVMIGGAGRGFGLDNWVMPWLQKWWNGTRLAQRTYLYVDEPTLKKKKK